MFHNDLVKQTLQKNQALHNSAQEGNIQAILTIIEPEINESCSTNKLKALLTTIVRGLIEKGDISLIFDVLAGMQTIIDHRELTARLGLDFAAYLALTAIGKEKHPTNELVLLLCALQTNKPATPEVNRKRIELSFLFTSRNSTYAASQSYSHPQKVANWNASKVKSTIQFFDKNDAEAVRFRNLTNTFAQDAILNAKI